MAECRGTVEEEVLKGTQVMSGRGRKPSLPSQAPQKDRDCRERQSSEVSMAAGEVYEEPGAMSGILCSETLVQVISKIQTSA